MPEPNGGAQGAHTSQQAAQGADAANNSQAQGSQDESAEPFNAERAQSTIRAQREEVKALKAQIRELDQLKTKLKTFEDAQLSESEKAQKQLTEAQAAIAERDARLRDLTVRHEFGAKAAGEGARRPDAIVRLYADDVETDADGKPKNIDALLKRARTDYPELFGAKNGSADGGSGSRQQAASHSMNDLIRRSAGRA